MSTGHAPGDLFVGKVLSKTPNSITLSAPPEGVEYAKEGKTYVVVLVPVMPATRNGGTDSDAGSS